MHQHLFKTKEEISQWLKSRGINRFTILPSEQFGYIVDVGQSVILSWMENQEKITNFPIKFNIVYGDFICNNNSLVSLEGSPYEVKGDFDCRSNNLSDLIGSPVIVRGQFNFSHNVVVSLQGGPVEVGGDYTGAFNLLTDLVGAPKQINGEFNVYNNLLTSLKGSPQKIGRSFGLYRNKLKNLEGCPEVINEFLDCSFNELDSFLYLPKDVGRAILWASNPELEAKHPYCEYLEEIQEYQKIEALALKEKADITAELMPSSGDLIENQKTKNLKI